MHEIAAGLVPVNQAQRAPRNEIVARKVRILVQPAPTPAPMPTPMVAVVAPQHSAPAHLFTRALREGRTGGAAASRRAERPEMPPVPNSKPVWDIGTGNSGRSALLAGSGTAGAGSAGTGPGAGSQGNGAGAASAQEPCGFVTFSDPHGSRFDPRTRGFWVDIRMSVHLGDGSAQSMILDYPWYYPNEAANPWSDQNVKDPEFPTRFQTPPPDRAGTEPPLVQYVAQHSTPDGQTLLSDCASPQPPSS